MKIVCGVLFLITLCTELTFHSYEKLSFILYLCSNTEINEVSAFSIE
jgi:hypothetical protein